MPIFKLLRRHDTSAPTVGKVYHGWFSIGEKIKLSDAPYSKAAEGKFDERWIYGHSEFAAAAYVVDPEFQSHSQSNNAEVMEGFHNTVERIGILLEVRRNMDQYKPIWAVRRKLIALDPLKQKTYESYPSDYPNATSPPVVKYAKQVNIQLTMYRNKLGVFARPQVMEAASEMPAHLWWDSNGGTTPELRTFATLILAQPASASIIERINSEFAFVKDRRRNRLGHDKANKLVGLFHNLRLILRQNRVIYSEPAVGWTQHDDVKSGIQKWGISNYSLSAATPLALT